MLKRELARRNHAINGLALLVLRERMIIYERVLKTIIRRNHARNGLELLVLCERLIFCESVLRTIIQIIFNLRMTITFIISCRDFNYWQRPN